MKKKRVLLDKLSGYLFLIGFLAAKLRAVPIVLLSVIFNYITFITYIVGYLFWYLAAIMYPSYPRKSDHWYGFAKFKEQYLLAAAIGLIASLLCAIMPSMVIPAAFLYVLSNVVWTISEFHKKNNPPNNEDNYSPTRQKFYIRYALLITMGSVLTAVSLVLFTIFPAATVPILMISSILGGGIIMGIAYHWYVCTFKKFPDVKIAHSYHKIPGSDNVDKATRLEVSGPTIGLADDKSSSWQLSATPIGTEPPTPSFSI